jgi:hypothetical protein
MPPEDAVQPEGSGTSQPDGRAEGETLASSTPTAPSAPTEDARAAFLNMVPKEFRDEPELKNYKDFAGMVKSHVNLVRMLGREPRVPPQDAPPDAWNQFYSALGRPDTADKYTLPNVPEGFEPNPEFLAGMTAAFHQAGLSNSQAHKVAEGFYSFITAQQDADAAGLAAYTERTERELKREWGGAYDNNVRLAHQFARDFGGQDLLDYLDGSGLGSNPLLIRAFAKAGRAMSEDRLGASRPADFGYTPAEAAAEIERLKLDKDFMAALIDRQHPGHQAAVDRRRGLFAAAYPTEEPT